MGLLDYEIQHGTICPTCIDKRRNGVLEIKSGKFGKFLGCNNYPKCVYTTNVGINLQTEATKLLKSKRQITRRSKRKNKRLLIEKKINKTQRMQRGQMFRDFKRLIAE
jgi:ssDNA-binding Zn-finger/Zn-ribbon topoisomerase 1